MLSQPGEESMSMVNVQVVMDAMRMSALALTMQALSTVMLGGHSILQENSCLKL